VSRNIIKYLIVVFTTIFFSACSQMEAPKPSFVLFDSEDEYILKTIFATEAKDFNTSAALFGELYKNTKKPEYKLEQARLYVPLKEFEKAQNSLLELKEQKYDSEKVNRALLDLYVVWQKKNEALLVAADLAKDTKSVENLELASSVYISFKESAGAIEYLKKAYEISKDTRYLARIADVKYILMQDLKGAIAELTSYVKLVGCDDALCTKLIFLNNRDKNLDGAKDVYRLLYETKKDSKSAKDYLEVLLVLKDYKGAQKLLESEKINDTLLLEVYKVQKEYKLAYSMVERLYNINKEPDMLAQMAILQYESAENKNDRALLKEVENKFAIALKKLDSHEYQNFLGYLLIDHDLDVARGMELVKKALQKKPDSPYYMDSLAWGHYKKKECKKAFEIMQKVVEKEGLDEEEIRTHWEKIQECVK